MKKIVFATPQDAEAAFYEAFTKSDLDAMMSVWSDDDDIFCVHPHGARVAGVADVRESWRRIFNNRQTLTFELREQHTLHGMMFAVHSVYEHIQLEDETREHGVTVATNVYMRTDRGWRMVAHHASPAPEPARGTARGSAKTLH